MFYTRNALHVWFHSLDKGEALQNHSLGTESTSTTSAGQALGERGALLSSGAGGARKGAKVVCFVAAWFRGAEIPRDKSFVVRGLGHLE